MESEICKSKSVTPADVYECKLPKTLKNVAERELRETDELRDFSIKAMRDWIMQNPRIEKCRMDSMWILKHLRFRKFSLPLAQEAMERHVVLRQGAYGAKFFHKDLDVLRSSVKNLFDTHPFCILHEKDKYGRFIVLVKPCLVQPGPPDLGRDVCTLMANIVEAVSEIEEVQINGVVYIFDVSGLSLQHLTILPIESWIKVGKNGEKCITLRHKGFHVVNVPAAVNFIINVALKSMPEKLRKRVKIYENFDQLDFIDKKILPKEYGYGGEHSMKDMLGPLWNLLLDKRDVQLKYKEMRVNEQMYPKACFDGSLDMLKVPLSSPDLFEQASRYSNDAVFGVQGSFRKLELD